MPRGNQRERLQPDVKLSCQRDFVIQSLFVGVGPCKQISKRSDVVFERLLEELACLLQVLLAQVHLGERSRALPLHCLQAVNRNAQDL